jgi:hypothetical protein
MKRILLIVLALLSGVCSAQTFKVQNLDVLGTSTLTGASAFTLSPTMPTPSVGDSSTKGATTAFIAKHASCPSILDFGGDNTNTTNNDTAYANTLASGPAGNACVDFPAGTYKFASQNVYTMPSASASVMLHGAGPDQTILTWSAGGGLKFNYLGPYNSAHIQGMTLTTGTTATGSAIFLNQQATTIANPANTALTDITNVTIRGADGYDVTDYWLYGLQIFGVSNVNAINFTVVGANFNGNGAYVTGNTTAIPVVYNFTLCTFNELNQGFIYGNNTQGVTFSQCNFTGNNYGIIAPAGESGLDQLTVIGSQFNNFIFSIDAASDIDALLIENNLFLIQNSTTCINLGSFSTVNIVGNNFNNAVAIPSNINGVLFDTYASFGASTVTGNSFNQMTTGVILNAASQYVNVQSNAYWLNTTMVINSGTNNTVGGGSK